MSRIYLILLLASLAFAPASMAATIGVWLDAAEIAALPTSGESWDKVKAMADASMQNSALTTRDDHNIKVLAAALVGARLNSSAYKQKARDGINQIMNASVNLGDVLATCRRIGTYAIAADIMDLASFDATLDASFRTWLANRMADDYNGGGGGGTVAGVHERRPNNFGTHAGASRAAVARYLGDVAELDRTATVFKGWVGDRTSYAGFDYGNLSWQCNASLPVGINKKDCTKDGHDIDGVLPDDQRRGGSFTWPPPKENYVYGALQGAIAQAYILHRAGYDSINWEDAAIKRAYVWLDEEANFPPDGDDTWQMPLVDHLYGTSFWGGEATSHGKNMGFADWTHSGASGPFPPTNQAPVVNVGPDQVVDLSVGASLTATATDDGLPTTPGSLTYLWSKVSGPGTVTFGTATALTTTADFSVDGVYSIKMVADDGALTGEDALTVTVVDDTPPPVNMPPIVDAGDDTSINVSGTLNLAATASDDGLPDPPAALTYQWAKVSGPGTVTFGSATALTTTATFSAVGVYTLSFEADDSVYAVAHELDVTVTADPNMPPSVNAGPDTSINVSGTLNLSATASDDGLPTTPGALSYQWAKDSGPGTVTFGSATALSTTATFSATGTYTLSIEADDGELTDTDTIDITVTEDPPEGVHHVATVTGTSESSTTVASGTVTAVDGDYYLAAVTSRSTETVSSVTGLGLTWTEIEYQCAGRNNSYVSLWQAQGATSGDGAVTATFASSVNAAVIAVSQYSGVSAACAQGATAEFNTNGASGACTGGTDTSSYSESLSVSAGDGLVYAAVSIRGKTHTVGSGLTYTERAEVSVGSGGAVAGLAVMDGPFTSSGAKTVDGTFSDSIDWALVTIEIH